MFEAIKKKKKKKEGKKRKGKENEPCRQWYRCWCVGKNQGRWQQGSIDPWWQMVSFCQTKHTFNLITINKYSNTNHILHSYYKNNKQKNKQTKTKDPPNPNRSRMEMLYCNIKTWNYSESEKSITF